MNSLAILIHRLFLSHLFLSILVSSGLFTFWLFVHLLASWTGYRMSDRYFREDNWLYRSRTFELTGHLYEKLGIRKWKQRLPEGDALVKDGFRKKYLPGGKLTIDYIQRFCIESRRAEWVHWLAFLPGPLFFFSGNVPLGTAMTVYALLANLPCIMAQRYNRIRLTRVSARLTAHSQKSAPASCDALRKPETRPDNPVP